MLMLPLPLLLLLCLWCAACCQVVVAYFVCNTLCVDFLGRSPWNITRGVYVLGVFSVSFSKIPTGFETLSSLLLMSCVDG
jgi:hypothetical protein